MGTGNPISSRAVANKSGSTRAVRVLLCGPTRDTCAGSTARWAPCSVLGHYARGRSPQKTRCRPATSEVDKRLSAPKLCAQPARAAFNPAPIVNIVLRAVYLVSDSLACGYPRTASAGLRNAYRHPRREIGHSGPNRFEFLPAKSQHEREPIGVRDRTDRPARRMTATNGVRRCAELAGRRPRRSQRLVGLVGQQEFGQRHRWAPSPRHHRQWPRARVNG